MDEGSDFRVASWGGPRVSKPLSVRLPQENDCYTPVLQLNAMCGVQETSVLGISD